MSLAIGEGGRPRVGRPVSFRHARIVPVRPARRVVTARRGSGPIHRFQLLPARTMRSGNYFPGATGCRSYDKAGMRIEFALDCSDLERTSQFWTEAAGPRVEGRIGDRYVSLIGHGVGLTLQRVAERKTVKNRLHIDLLVDGLEQEVHRLERIGERRLSPSCPPRVRPDVVRDHRP